MIGFLFEQTQRRIVGVIRPFYAEPFDVLADGLDGAEELALFDREGADGKTDRRALLQQQQGFEQGERVLTARERHGYAIAIADHLESADGFPDLAQ